MLLENMFLILIQFIADQYMHLHHFVPVLQVDYNHAPSMEHNEMEISN